MSKKELRGIAIGILVATSLLAYFFYFTDSAKRDVTEEDVKAYLAANDKVAVSSKEYESLLDAKRAALTNEPATPQPEANKPPAEPAPEKEPAQPEQPEEEQVYSTVLTVSEGTSIYDVAERLESEKIIADRKELIDYLQNNGLEKYLQLGTYELNSKMTIEEVAKTIATPKS